MTDIGLVLDTGTILRGLEEAGHPDAARVRACLERWLIAFDPDDDISTLDEGEP
jgi:hypothetical protein